MAACASSPHPHTHARGCEGGAEHRPRRPLMALLLVLVPAVFAVLLLLNCLKSLERFALPWQVQVLRLAIRQRATNA
jgi:hypothetical protein